MNTQKKEPELNNSLDWPRIKHLLELGIFAALMVLIGDMLLGYGVSDASLSGLERQLSTYLHLPDSTLFWSAFLGFIGIPLEAFCYPHRAGVIKRSAVYAAEPEYKDREFEGLKPEQIRQYRDLISSGANDELKIGRLEQMTANDFFRACELGYEAIGKQREGFTPVQLYLRYSDGRDEGLTGKGHGLNEGPGIDFDDPAAWEEWYFGARGGGHPWEVVPGGNDTHMDLFVCHDGRTLEWKVRAGDMTQEEADQHPVGFYYQITGKYRPMESVNFYLALHDAGLPVLISDAEEILARFDASDYIGIVPHSMIPKYCESMFPKKYGRVIDYMHVHEEGLEKYKGDIIWLPEDPAELKQ